MGNKIIRKILMSPRLRLAIAGLTCVSAVAFSIREVYADTVNIGLQMLSGTIETNSVTVTTGETIGLTTIPTATGSLAVGKSTVKITTNTGGYQLYISGPNVGTNGYTSLYYEGDEDAGIDDEIRGISAETPVPFTSTNQWGYAVKGNSINGFSAETAYEAAISVGPTTDTGIISGLNWRGITKNMSLVRTSATGDTDATASDNPIYYAIYVDNNLMTGEYRNTIIYTAFVDGANKLIISPSQIKNGEIMTITSEYISNDNPITNSNQINVKLLDGENPVGTCDNINIQRDGKNALLKFNCTVRTNTNFKVGKAYDVTVELAIPGRRDTLSFHADDVWGDGVMKDGAKMQNMVADSCRNAETNKTYKLKDARDDKSYLVTKLIDGNCWMTQNLSLEGGTMITPDNSNIRANYILPASSTDGFSDDSVAYMYNGTHIDNTGNTKGNIASVGKSNTGAYYGWLTAIAKNDGNYSASDMTALNTASAQAGYSICPKNWRLPLRDNGMIAITNMYSLADFRAYWNQGVTGTDLLIGRYGNSALGYSGGGANWWSRESNSATYARYMYQDSSGFHIGDSHRYLGNSVRCVLEV